MGTNPSPCRRPTDSVEPLCGCRRRRASWAQPIPYPIKCGLHTWRDTIPPTLLLKAYKTDGVKVFWNSPAELVICYGQPTHIYDFRNYYEYAEETWDHLYKVEVLLRRVQKLQEC